MSYGEYEEAFWLDQEPPDEDDDMDNVGSFSRPCGYE